MKRIYQAVLVASVLSLPLLSQAETSNPSFTHAQVRSELVAAEQAGQHPRSYQNYPDPVSVDRLQHATRRAVAQ